MSAEDLSQTFVIEARELLELMESRLLETKAAGHDAEAVNELFRVAHTIKGSAGVCGFEHIVRFSHVMESVLEEVRGGRQALDRELVALLLACCDGLRSLVDAVAVGRTAPDPETEHDAARLLERLARYLGRPEQPAEWHAEQPDARQPGSVTTAHWQLSLRFGTAALKNGIEPLSFIRYLQDLGEIVSFATSFEALPDAEQMDPESCYLGFEIGLESAADRKTLADVFELADGDCQVQIQRAPAAPAPLGEPSIRRASLPPEAIDAAQVKPREPRDDRARDTRSVRVDAEKLDRLIDLVGELIIASANTNLIARGARLPELQQCTAILSSLVEAVRDNALQLRMVKIGATFKRFQRVVYDVSRELGKDVAISVSGEDAELDKTVVEKIGDPLLHLVRNAVDHGIEPSEVRTARGKPATGRIRLNAFHDSGSIVIQVSDDGGGLKRDKILGKARERGLVEAGRSLSDSEIYNLIFEPGFSTAEQVTNLSGRGVGMDVVKRNITALRGSVDIESREGLGTTVTVRLPLTLAIINGFLVGLGKSVFIVPLELIEECVELTVDGDHDYTELRGSVLPFVRLRGLFGLEQSAAARQNMVVVRSGEQRVGLVVDTLLGEFQTVIKPLGKLFSRVDCIAGSSILGSGEVALILDVPRLVRRAAAGFAPELERQAR